MRPLSAARQRLAESHTKIAVWLGARYARLCRVETDDLVGPAMLGLCRAAARWDEHDGRATFATFARQYIRGEILDEIQRMGRWRRQHGLYGDLRQILDAEPTEVDERLWAAWQALPARDRDIVERCLRGEPRRQTRAELQCDPAKIYRRSLARLRAALGPGGI